MMHNIETNKIYCMDAKEGMNLLPDDYIDLTVTSPPYDDLRTYKGYSFDFEPIAKELYRVTKPGGVVVWVVGDATVNGSETGTSFRQALYFKETGFNLHDTMIYEKDIPPINANRYEPKFEYMFVFSRGSPAKFNPINIKKNWTDRRASKNWHRSKDSDFRAKGGSRPDVGTKVAGNVWFYVASGGNSTRDKIAYQHPAIFPEQLAYDHIISWSNPGDIVLDPFMGSGTTGKMAALNRRHYIGFDISEEYCEIARKRISEHTAQQNIFSPGVE